MAAYPTLPISLGSKASPEAGIKIDRASNGAARGRRLYTADKRSFDILHAYLLPAQQTTLMDFYTANKDAEVDFTFTGVTYTCIFADAPQPEHHSGQYISYRVRLEEV
jgi:hypothetical protein